MKNVLISILLLFSAISSHANQPIVIKNIIDWSEPVEFQVNRSKSIIQHSFKNAYHTDLHPSIPIYSDMVPVPGQGKLVASLEDADYEEITNVNGLDDKFISSYIDIHAEIHISRKKAIGGVSFIPIRKNSLTGNYERLISFEIHLNFVPTTMPSSSRTPTTFDSELRHGDIYKLSIGKSGIYKLSYDYLKNTLNIDVDNIDPRKIKIFGNGGGMLPEPNSYARIDDLMENSIIVQGEGDGKFNSNDYILFYAQGANVWRHRYGSFERENNIYTDSSFYFLRILNSDGTNGLRIQNQSSISNTAYTTSEYDALKHHEEDVQNLLDFSSSGHGSGKQWTGKTFKVNTSQDFSFSFSGLVSNEPVEMRAYICARTTSPSSNHKMVFSSNNTPFFTQPLGSVSAAPEGPYADTAKITTGFIPNNDNITLNLEYIKPTSSSEAWLDYITLIGRQQLRYLGTTMHFRDRKSLDTTSTTYSISNVNNNVAIWDITDPLTPAKQDVSGSSTKSFGVMRNANQLREFVAFEESQAIEPVFIEKIQNQNLHNLAVPDLLVIYHKAFEPAALQFADHRRSHSGLKVNAVDIEQVYNEFGSGKPDVTAIRDFVKMFYDRSVAGSGIKYLLLFGGASFDYKNLNNELSNSSFVPTFQSYESINTIYAFPTDDYYSLLDDNEGGSLSNGSEDIGVGRFPGRTLSELQAIVNKVIHYDTEVSTYTDWRNRLLFVADDEDSNIHFKDADGIAETTRADYPNFNLDKIYFDAFNQVTTPGGNRYPEVSESIVRNIDFKGNLVVNYMGHGGPNSWAQERVLLLEDIGLFDNKDKMPLFVTATCSFGPYDDYKIPNAGEELLLNPNGGAIGLFTTVRAVFASTNQRLTKAVFDRLFEPINGQVPAIGEVMRLAKVSLVTTQSKLNGRKFALLGDPSMNIAIPEYDVLTTKINGNAVSATYDTIGAMQQVTIEGMVVDQNGNLATDFNGIIAPTVFDKVKSIKTLVNDGNSRLDSFKLQKNVIFKGLASVTDGRFEFDFIVPIDIDYSFGYGKISYYAHDPSTKTDASGNLDTLIVGGTAIDGAVDNQPPKVEVFMNNEDFAFGGITDENPFIYVKLSDDLGINTTGTSVGHDITGVLDNQTKNVYVLNDYYESELNNSKQGIVKYPLVDLEEGRHSITVKAWDISNKPGEDFTEFVVAQSGELALNHVLNYPNPFTTSTNFQFEHNLPGTMFDVQIQIYTISGSLLKTIDETVSSDGYRVSNIHWDGKDDFGDHIGKGVYIYKVQIAAENGEDALRISNSAFEKLVILK